MRRLIVLACVVAVLVGVLLSPAAGGSTPAVLVPVDPLFGFVVLPLAPAGDTTPSYACVPSGPSPSRAPPSIA